MPKALITGITGQDGSYLTELLLGKGYEVHGLVRQIVEMTGQLTELVNQVSDQAQRSEQAMAQQLFLEPRVVSALRQPDSIGPALQQALVCLYRVT